MPNKKYTLIFWCFMFYFVFFLLILLQINNKSVISVRPYKNSYEFCVDIVMKYILSISLEMNSSHILVIRFVKNLAPHLNSTSL